MYIHVTGHLKRTTANPRTFLRASYRAGRKTRIITLANITWWPEEALGRLRHLLQLRRDRKNLEHLAQIDSCILGMLEAYTPPHLRQRFNILSFFFKPPYSGNRKRKKAS